MPVKVIGPSDDQLKQKITDAARKKKITVHCPYCHSEVSLSADCPKCPCCEKEIAINVFVK